MDRSAIDETELSDEEIHPKIRETESKPDELVLTRSLCDIKDVSDKPNNDDKFEPHVLTDDDNCNFEGLHKETDAVPTIKSTFDSTTPKKSIDTPSVKTIRETMTTTNDVAADPPAKLISEEKIGSERLKALKGMWDLKVLVNWSIKPPLVTPQLFMVFEQPESADCVICHKRVYAAEKLANDGLIFHKSCFKCCICGVQLRLETSQKHQKQIYCKNHYRDALNKI